MQSKVTLALKVLIVACAFSFCKSLADAVQYLGYLFAILVFVYVGNLLLPEKSRSTFFAMALGQFVLLLACFSLMALNSSAHYFFDFSFPFWIIAGAAVLLLTIALKNRVGISFSKIKSACQNDLAFVFFLGSLAPVLAVAGQHLSPLIIDMLHHQYWLGDILNFGYIPLQERQTNILSTYPKIVHVLSAIWHSLSFSDHFTTAVTLKMMPFLQGSLFFLAFLESGAKVLSDSVRSILTWAHLEVVIKFLLFAFGFFYLLAIAPTYYPVFDLLGTGRIASASLAGFPALFALWCLTQQEKRNFAWLLFVFPLSAFLSLLLNPAVLIPSAVFNFCIVSLVLGAELLRLRSSAKFSAKAFLKGLPVCGSRPLALLMLCFSLVALQDSFFSSQLLWKREIAQALTGVVPFKVSVEQGKSSPLEHARDQPEEPFACRVNQPGCLFNGGVLSVAEALRRPVNNVKELVFQNTSLKEYVLTRMGAWQPLRHVTFLRPKVSAVYGFLVLIFGVLCILGLLSKRTRCLGLIFSFALILETVFYLMNEFVLGVAWRLMRTGSFQFHLLEEYLKVSGIFSHVFYVGPFFALTLTCGTLVVFVTFVRSDFREWLASHLRGANPSLTVLFFFSIGIAATQLSLQIQREFKGRGGLSASLSRQSLPWLDSLNQKIKTQPGSVLLRPWVFRQARSSWIFPASAAELSPHLEAPAVFGGVVGNGIRFSTVDYEADLCSFDKMKRDQFFQKSLASWYVVDASLPPPFEVNKAEHWDSLCPQVSLCQLGFARDFSPELAHPWYRVYRRTSGIAAGGLSSTAECP